MLVLYEDESVLVWLYRSEELACGCISRALEKIRNRESKKTHKLTNTYSDAYAVIAHEHRTLFRPPHVPHLSLL